MYIEVYPEPNIESFVDMDLDCCYYRGTSA